MPKLSDPKRELFCFEYLKDFNASRAAKAVGYAAGSAGQRGWELLQLPEVQGRLAEIRAARIERMEFDADRVLQELAAVGFSNMKDYVEWGPDGVSIKSSAELTRAVAAAVIEVKEVPNQYGIQRSLKLHGKVEALKSLGQHFGLFDGEDKGKEPIEVVIVDKRAKP